ncbi:putative F-box/kelch-repeat protein At1g20790 [Eutrema salsugineum]|nr:putative F-box/kelch-repeat protein At1g20790 [Eutrema salsugineum]
MKPVYLDGTLHRLRNDGSIIAFNPRIEQARHIIPSKLLFGVGDNRLTLISATMEMIYALNLESIHTNSKWTLTRLIRNKAVNEGITLSWDVDAYDGKCLVVRTMTNLTDNRVVYG